MADKLIRTIKAISVRNKEDGSIGFLTDEEEKHWYNVVADVKVLDELLKSTIQKGNMIEFETENGFPKNFVLKSKAKEQGAFTDDMTTFEDLLADAHKKFENGFTIKTQMIENDWEKQRAIFKATVITDETTMHVYEAYGDATQENCGDMVKKHYIRMAETRAIARALRWATNNAKAAEEETENGTIPESELAQE